MCILSKIIKYREETLFELVVFSKKGNKAGEGSGAQALGEAAEGVPHSLAVAKGSCMDTSVGATWDMPHFPGSNSSTGTGEYETALHRGLQHCGSTTWGALKSILAFGKQVKINGLLCHFTTVIYKR